MTADAVTTDLGTQVDNRSLHVRATIPEDEAEANPYCMTCSESTGRWVDWDGEHLTLGQINTARRDRGLSMIRRPEREASGLPR